VPDEGSMIPWLPLPPWKLSSIQWTVDGWMALEAVLFLVYLLKLSIMQSNDRMTHDDPDGMRKVWSCSVKVISWHFPTGTVYIQENVSRDSQSPG
jgi:hypothetical protein